MVGGDSIYSSLHSSMMHSPTTSSGAISPNPTMELESIPGFSQLPTCAERAGQIARRFSGL